MLKVAILGPESTGKSTLTLQLAKHYNAAYVLEYAREYVEHLNSAYTYQDVCQIAQHQIEQELAFECSTSKPDFIFFDTDLIITKVWFSYCFQTVPDFVTDRLQTGFFDLYLLCAPDLPWVPDAVREHGDDREFFFDWYKREIELLNKPYHVISGTDYLRFHSAVEVLDLLN
jgi:NadR type nicotinamide-nucleotide adenylyltransferase